MYFINDLTFIFIIVLKGEVPLESMDKDTIIRLPLKDKSGEVIAHTIIDEYDYDKVKTYTLCKRGNQKFYAVACKNNIKIPLHHIILSKPEKGYVVDHINGDSLDNRKSNLQIASHSQNAQNRAKKEGCASKYIGVWKSGKKWVAQCTDVKITTFENEEDAAKCYDMYAYIKFGCNARTNNLVDYTECIDMTLEDCLNKFRKQKVMKTLPNGVYIVNEKYFVKIVYKNLSFKAKLLDTLDKAMEHLDTFRKIVDEQKAKEEHERLSTPILRNSEGVAVIPITNNDKQVVDHVLISDEDYHDLVRFSWSLSSGYAVGRPQGKRKMSMHLYLFNKHNTEVYDIVDHINQNKLDNRRENLRGNSHSGNSHNSFKKKEGATSQYKGVCFKKNRWNSEITKDKKYYYIGSFNTEREAAIAYNNKAKELYGEFACLNIIPDHDI
jgi:hypothetical protein